MMIGWILEGNAFAKKPILGKSCSAYVREAMEELELVLIHDREELTASTAERVLVVRGDAPCLTGITLNGLAQAAAERPCVLLSPDANTPLAIAISREALQRVMCAQPALLSAERLVAAMNECGEAPRVWYDDLAETYLTVTDAQSYAEAFQIINRAAILRHQENGVIILDPARTIIEDDVRIGAGTLIYAGNTLQGRTVIGENCVLYPNNRMQNAAVGDETTVESSVLLDCAVGRCTTVGPYAYLRPNSHVGDHCRIGDFVEIKNSSIDDGTKVSHLTYVGDSDLGKEINLGCGVVFVNYDGKTKNRSKVEDHAFIGCNCNLVAPVHIGKNAYLAAGSTVVEDVPEDALFVARSRGVTKADWVKRRKDVGKL
ncbi:MAG: DapH/DapD/GlmU-related protein [Clostridia bacterium]